MGKAAVRRADHRFRGYMAYGLSINSEIDLPELETRRHEEACGRADLTISFASVDGPMPSSHELRLVEFSEDRLYFAWNGIGRFAVDRSGAIAVDPLAEVDHGLLSLVILGPVMAGLLNQHGHIVLHGSVIVLPSGDAVAFVGDNGAGKSTLAGAFLKRGFPVGADDVIAIEDAGNGDLWVRAGFPSIKLSREALQELTPLPGSSLPPVPPEAAKLRFRHNLPAPPLSRLAHIFVIERGDTPSTRICDASQSLALLLRYAYMLKFGRHLEAASAGSTYFRQCARLAQHVPVSKLIVPHGHDALMPTVDLVHAAVQRAT